MPDFEGFATGLEKNNAGMDRIKLQEVKIDPVNVGMTEEPSSFDFMGALGEMKESVAAGGNGGDTGLTLDEGLGAEFLGGLVTDKFVDVHQQMLEEADRLIREKKYTDAIQVLDELLDEAPEHHQALYLKAMCLTSKKESHNEAALEILLPLTKARLEGSLNTKVKMLRERIKKAVLMRMMVEHLLLTRSNMRSKVIDSLKRFIFLIPEEPVYPFMLSGTLMMDDRHDEALKVVEKAITEFPEDQAGRLREIRDAIKARMIPFYFKQVIGFIRGGSFGNAHKELKALRKTQGNLPMWAISNNYVKDMGGGGIMGRMFGSNKPKTGAAARGGSKAQIDQFYQMIFGKEVQSAQAHISKKQYASATKILLPLVEQWVPAFSYANYLCSVALYFQLQHAFAGGKFPDLEEAIADLEKARAMAKIGSLDSRIKDIKNLTAALEGSIKTLFEVRKMKSAMSKEVKPIQKVVDEYNRIMEGAKGGIGSKKQWKKAVKEMTRAVANITAVRSKVKHPGNKELLDKLYKAATTNLGQLKNMEDDMEAGSEAKKVKKNWDSFGAIAKVLNNPSGIRSRKALEKLRTKVSNLKTKAVSDRRGMRSTQAREAMDKLISQLDQVLGMFNR